ncbi:hypothetical protein ACTWQB_14450 [Piscibacillus sp. B03]
MRFYLKLGTSLFLLCLLFSCSSSTETTDSIELDEEKIDGSKKGALVNKINSKDKEVLKNTLRDYIFDEYMKSPDYGYAKGINWAEDEIWSAIEQYKELNNGKEGTLFDQAKYLSTNAPIKDNWKELFLKNWNKSPYSTDNEIEKMIDKGDTVWIYTDTVKYTGEEGNYPFIILDKRTGAWHG